MRKLPGTAALAILLLAAVPAPSPGADAPSPAPAWTIESAQARLQYLKAQEAGIGDWVEKNWETEFSRTIPGLGKGPRRKGEKEADYKARDLQRRLAAAGVKERLWSERAEWIRKERASLLAAEIRELIPARLGPYDAGRDDYPLALGFGWPSELSVRFRVPKENRKIFELRYASRLPARFRVDEQGEVFLLSLGTFWKESDRVTPVVSVTPPGPRQLWEGSHASWVTSVAFRPDGEQVLSAGADGTVAAWDAVTGHRAFLLDNVELALSVAYSPDGKTFATGGADSVLRLRDARDGRELWSLPARGRILAVAFSPDGRYIATGDGSGIAGVWDVASRRETATVDLGQPVWSVVFNGPGSALAAGGEWNAVVLWSLLYGRRTWSKELEWPVYSLAFARNPGVIAVGGGGNRMLVLRERDGSVEWSADMGGEVRSVGFDPSGTVLGGG
ncbi:MAG TPA: PQQ-binding-like beta-propeller repeat protein, partial [Candidatus Deferrimicrobiaceae bacterium]